MINYSPALPNDKNQNPLQESPAPILAKQRFTSENATASSVVSFGHDTTAIEVAAIGGAGVAIKWIATGDTGASVITLAGATSNYDHVIPTNGTNPRRFVIPREIAGSYAASVQGLNRAEGLYQRVAFKSFGISSVMLSEY